MTEFLDETGMPVLYTSGWHFNRSAGGRITFPDRRWLRFPVRDTGPANAIMTAVDQSGNKVARYRLTGSSSWAHKVRNAFLPRLDTVEITVHPRQSLTDELVLALAISAIWLNSYFDSGGGGDDLRAQVNSDHNHPRTQAGAPGVSRCHQGTARVGRGESPRLLPL
jgi:hypothetical protein